MKYPVYGVLALAIAAANGTANAQSTESTNSNQNVDNYVIENMTVYGEPEKTKAATKLNLSLLETPQLVSVISRDQIDDFSLLEVNSLLTYAPGVTVEQVETGRTYYTARGFDIVNFQYDGVGVPFSYGLTQGHDDTAIYEKVEVVKGATGLTTGLANPSATINYVRKRPTEDLQASVLASTGNWNQYRLAGDISGTIIDEKLTGRLVISKQDGDSYLDRYTNERDVFYGMISANLTDTTRLNLSHSVNDSFSDANSSGALPLFYSDGTVTDYDVSTNTAPEWAYQEVDQVRSFVELEQGIGENWLLKAIYSRNVQNIELESFYLSDAPDPITEEGLLARASFYEADDNEDIVDLFISGSFSLWGQQHELVAGFNLADIELTGRSVFTSEWQSDPVGADWASGNTPQPTYDLYDAASQSTDIEQEQNSYYLSSRLNFTDSFSVLLGGRTVDIEQDGVSYGTPQEVSEQSTVPYVGATYEVLDGTMLYASYSEVFKQQTWVDASLSPLGPVQGEGSEIGIKHEFPSGNALLTVALFKSSQENFGEWQTRDDDTGLNIYQGVAFESDGFEIELAGEVLDGLNASAGYTRLDIEDENGEDTRRHIPTQQLKLALAYQVPALPSLRVGVGINWQNDIYVEDTEVQGSYVDVQGSYVLADIFARYHLNSNLTLSLNIDNAGDEKHLLSPQWGQANYGAPRNLTAAANWHF